MANSCSTSTNPTVYLKDYVAPDFKVSAIDLRFDLTPGLTRVSSELVLQRQGVADCLLILDGEMLRLISIAINGCALESEDYELTPHSLTVLQCPDQATVTIVTECEPNTNTELSGLYISNATFCTQCEAEGFRRITYFPDRPDVLTVFTVTLQANKTDYPVLLSNGNLLEQGTSKDDTHWARWHDPHPKPSYLFALVAGDLDIIEDTFTTASGKQVSLYLYAQQHNIDRCDHAMHSLKNAMRWDQQVYGREYDLDRFMIVAVDDFNMGAMENKGLNIFNSKYVLANPDTATDTDYQDIEGVIGHEYFHNWSGNRVTCRDWFQLSLKEGFTVFRDQEFSADMGSRGVKRIQDVNVLRTHQFREDAGPMAHPVRPESYQQINNFYTVTVYNKGAEVVRMLHTLMGEPGFRAGTDLYFKRHDGQAVTTDDFIRAMEDANQTKLDQFQRWYQQAGTPTVKIDTNYNPQKQRLELTLEQSCPATPGQTDKLPFHIPLRVALLSPTGKPMAVTLDGGNAQQAEHVLEMTLARQQFVFNRVSEPVVLSVGRGFSAPIKINFARAPHELDFLIKHDDDPYSRWQAGQQRALDLILNGIEDYRAGHAVVLAADYIEGMRVLLESDHKDMAVLAEAMKLPTPTYIGEFCDTIDPIAIDDVRFDFQAQLATALSTELQRTYNEHKQSEEFDSDARSIAQRALRNTCLSYLALLSEHETTMLDHYYQANNMTDRIAALAAMVNYGGEIRDQGLADFERHWQHDPLVIDKWFVLQATARHADTLERVKQLRNHKLFDLRNPNKVRSLIGAFAHGNPLHFHRQDGEGYRFIADHIIELDGLNPQIAARLMGGFNHWRRYDATHGKLMKNEIQRVLEHARLSKDVREIASKGLAQAARS